MTTECVDGPYGHEESPPVATMGDADAIGVVYQFLRAMERRELDEAKTLLGDGFEMVFPGDVRMSQLEELFAWGGTRYRFARKTHERYDHVGSVVYTFGTLSGEWLDGSSFSGIRFIDRFELTDGRIVRQQVWNDVAAVKSA